MYGMRLCRPKLRSSIYNNKLRYDESWEAYGLSVQECAASGG